MKKCIILILIMLVCLCGCSSKQSTKTTILCQRGNGSCSGTVVYEPSVLYEIPNVIYVETVEVDNIGYPGCHVHYIIIYNEED